PSCCYTTSYAYPLPLSVPATPPPEISTLSLHDALPIWFVGVRPRGHEAALRQQARARRARGEVHALPGAGLRGRRDAVDLGQVRDRKSTRLNSSHRTISYAVFCLKKKNNKLDQYSY